MKEVKIRQDREAMEKQRAINKKHTKIMAKMLATLEKNRKRREDIERRHKLQMQQREEREEERESMVMTRLKRRQILKSESE